jgi:hypothetical protein
MRITSYFDRKTRSFFAISIQINLGSVVISIRLSCGIIFGSSLYACGVSQSNTVFRVAVMSLA